MIRIAVTLLALASVAILAGCYSAPIMPPGGMLYANISAPITVNPNGDVSGSARGEATVRSYLGLVAVGDCSITAAIEDGNVSDLQFMDYKFKNLLGLQDFTTVTVGD